MLSRLALSRLTLFRLALFRSRFSQSLARLGSRSTTFTFLNRHRLRFYVFRSSIASVRCCLERATSNSIGNRQQHTRTRGSRTHDVIRLALDRVNERTSFRRAVRTNYFSPTRFSPTRFSPTGAVHTEAAPFSQTLQTRYNRALVSLTALYSLAREALRYMI